MKNLKVLDMGMSKESSDALEDLRYRQEQARMAVASKNWKQFEALAGAPLETELAIFWM